MASLPTSMVSRAAQLALSTDEITHLMNDIVSELQSSSLEDLPASYTYENFRIVIEETGQTVKIMTEDEYRRLYPLMLGLQDVRAITHASTR